MNQDRYIRQILLDQFGAKAQRRLEVSHVVVIGCGGLGSIVAPYLAGAGVGKITLVDGDTPQLSNLHRQVFFTKEDQLTKAEHLAKHISALNDEIEVRACSMMVSKANVEEIIEDADMVVECTDQIQVKYLINDYCHIEGVPLVYGAIHKYSGYVSTFFNDSDEGIHLRDIFPEPNNDIPTCSEVGVMGTLAGLIGMLQANEVIKYISQVGQTLGGRLLTYDVLTNEQMILKLKKNFHQEMEHLYYSNLYQPPEVCSSSDVTWDDIMSQRSAYDLISILPEHEHIHIDDHVINIPITGIDPSKWKTQRDRTQALYCHTGKLSMMIVEKIKKLHPSAQIVSIAGGVARWQDSVLGK